MSQDEFVQKLVRDGIPEIIQQSGCLPDIAHLTDADARPFVLQKLLEEAQEAFHAGMSGDTSALKEELADVLSVIDRLLTISGLTWDEVQASRASRDAARGQFAGNILLRYLPDASLRRHVGPDSPLLSALVGELRQCLSASWAVSFVMRSGVEMLLPEFRRALARGVSIRLLTSDYLDITDPDALAMLLSLPGDLQLRAYQEAHRSYHPKAYLFEHVQGRMVGYVGSSNLSAAALTTGLEWNYRIDETDRGWSLQAMATIFDRLFQSGFSVPVDEAFVAAYRQRRVPRPITVAETWPVGTPKPRPAQVEALTELARLRDDGETRGLVIAATGIGKTFLAAFDSRAFDSILFLAHRDELLNQASRTFQQVRPAAVCGFYRGGEHDTDADILFASVATLSRPEHLSRFAPDRFRYIVVDEFHHAAAASYRAILHYFSADFVLGLTATPYRADNRDVFALCDGNVAYRLTFMEAIAFGWLAPFHYYGVYDDTDYSAIPWRNGRYSEEALTKALETERRSSLIIDHYRRHVSTAGIAFCVSIAHANYMAAQFASAGIPAMAVHSGPGAVGREQAIAALQSGAVKVLCTVDLFNEGVDIPEVDLVMFLRPTESTTIFLQQLGRGLRLHHAKQWLTVLDFIGNYKRTQYKLLLLSDEAQDDSDPSAVRKAIEALKSGELKGRLPSGVEINFDLQAVDLMQRMAAQGEPRRLRLEEAYRDVREKLGHRPTLLELQRWGVFDLKAYRQEFGAWFRFLRQMVDLAPGEIILEKEAGDFLLELEKTAMTKSYKMVMLNSMLVAGAFGTSVSAVQLAHGFRAFFSASRRHRQDIAKTDIEAIDEVSDDTLVAYLERNPIAAWTNTGKSGQRRTFFEYDKQRKVFRYVGPRPEAWKEFVGAIRERVEARLGEYFEHRFERQNVFNVINAGPDRGIIMLGSNEQAPIPRGAGWTTVLIDGRRMHAKFAKIAINVLKEAPDDGARAPNRLTEVLEEWFGKGGYLPQRGNQVRIAPSVADPSVWVIEPYRRHLALDPLPATEDGARSAIGQIDELPD